MIRKGGGLPERAKQRWRQVYERSSYRELPWFSSTPFGWVETAVKERWLERGGRILDLGCGAGTNSLFLARSGYRAQGIDLAPAAIAAATRRAASSGLSAEFEVADALRLPFPRRRFDGAIDVGCFHTLPVPLRGAYRRELARVLRPGGRYVLAWVAREYTSALGPPHRPSMEEVVKVFEPEFQILRTEFLAGRWGRIPAYGAVMERRSRRQPPPR